MNKELLIKYIEGKCTEEEKIAIIKWLDSDPEHLREYMALRKLNDITIWQSPPKQQLNKTKPFRSWKSVSIELAKIAAILAILLVISRLFNPKHSSTIQTLHVPAGQRADITLEDGTQVWLNANTTFTFPNQFSGDTREVTLDGEGYFKVTSNKRKPFIVRTEKYSVKVLGTTFNVMAYSGNDFFETALLEGSVEISETDNSKNINLHPNELVTLENDQLIVLPIKHTDHFLWKDGIISFDDEYFPEMIKKLELYFDLKIEVRNKKILDYRCTGKFRTKDGIEHILKVLQLSNKFSYTINDKRNLIVIE